MQVIRTFVVLLLSFITIISCKKNNTVTPVIKDAAKIMFVHAAANTDGLDFILGTAKKNADSIKYGKNTSYFDIEATAGKKSPYMIALSKTGVKLKNDSIQLTTKLNYTFYGYQDSTKNNPFELLLSIDDLALPSPGKAKVRIIHLVPDGSKNNYAPSVDIQFVPAGAAFDDKFDFQGLRFKTISQFKEIDKGVKDMWVKIGDTRNPVTNLKNITIAEGKIYTFVIRGYIFTQFADKVATITQVANN